LAPAGSLCADERPDPERARTHTHARARAQVRACASAWPQPRQAMGKKGSANGTKDLVTRARDTADLRSLLQVLKEATTQDVGSALATILNLLATKAAADTQGLAAEALEAGEGLLAVAITNNGGRPPESAVTIMVRLCCMCGKPQRALSLVEEARQAGMKPKLRNLTPILAQAGSTGDLETCDGVWAKLKEMGLDPQDTEYAAMLRGLRGKLERQREVLRQMLEDLPLPSDPPLVEEIAFSFGVQNVAELRGAEPPHREGLPEEGGGSWRVGWTSVDLEGRCSLTGRSLQALRISAAEEKELFACTAKLANDSGCNRGFRAFQRWIREQEPYDVIIDGANVGFNNQNHEGGHFQYHQIEEVVQHFRERRQRTLVVLHPKWMKENADLSVMRRKRRKFDPVSKDEAPNSPEPGEDEEEEDDDDAPDIVYPHEGITEAERTASAGTPLALIRGWKELGVLVCVPFHDCDDWYWLYAALHSFQRGREQVQVISNDHMRDHHWRMDSQKAFVQWQDRHMTRVSILHAEDASLKVTVQLCPPRPYSLRSQVSQDGQAWHFPIPAIRSRAEQLSTGRPASAKELEAAEHRWLVAWRTPLPPPPEPAS